MRAEARYYVPVTRSADNLPLYYPLGDEGQVSWTGGSDPGARQGVIASLVQPADRTLNYPRAPSVRGAPHANVLLV